jgi:flagellar basal-body rod modification protein FlgD
MTTSVSSIGSPAAVAAAAAPPQTAAAAAASATSDQFMKLFIAQLQNQDPLSPQDPSAFLGQLAQMSQLEQTTETNTRLASLADAQSATARASMSDMVGRNITANASTLEVRDGSTPLGAIGGPQLGVSTSVGTKSLELDILDGSGKTVKAIQLGGQAAGSITVDPKLIGTLPVGTYSVVVKGKGIDGSDVAGTTSVTGKVDALQMSDAGDRFRVGPFNVSPSTITSVGAIAP